MPVYSNVESKLEQAVAAYLTALGTITDQIATGKASADKEPPIVICEAGNAQEDPPATGNYWIDCSVTVKSIAAVDVDEVDPKTADDSLLGIVFNAMQMDDLAAQLTDSLDDFTCIGVKDLTQNSTQNGDCWVNTIEFKAWCYGS